MTVRYNTKIKTFEDLKHKTHIMGFGTQATMNFDNGYGVSVVFGGLFHSDGVNTYEVAILKDGAVCYDSGITNDVIGYVTSEEVTNIMKEVQELKK